MLFICHFTSYTSSVSQIHAALRHFIYTGLHVQIAAVQRPAKGRSLWHKWAETLRLMGLELKPRPSGAALACQSLQQIKPQTEKMDRTVQKSSQNVQKLTSACDLKCVKWHFALKNSQNVTDSQNM